MPRLTAVARNLYQLGSNGRIVTTAEDLPDEKVIPNKNKLKDSERRDARETQWQYNPSKNREVTTAVDSSGLDQFSRQGANEILKNENAERHTEYSMSNPNANHRIR